MILEEMVLARTEAAQADILARAGSRWGSPFAEGFRAAVRSEAVWVEKPGLLAELFRAYVLFHQAAMEALGSRKPRLVEPSPDEPAFEPGTGVEYPAFFAQVMQAARGDARPALELARRCARLGDSELRAAAVAVIRESRGPQRFQALADYMEANGVDSLEYEPGGLFLEMVAVDPALADRAREMLRRGPARLREGILHALRVGGSIAAGFRTELLELMEGEDSEAKSLAIIAVGRSGMHEPDAVEALWRCTASKTWYVRGNAIRSASMLGADPERFIARAAELLGDGEGNDWTVSESAATALQEYLRGNPGLGQELRSLAQALPETARRRLADLLDKA